MTKRIPVIPGAIAAMAVSLPCVVACSGTDGGGVGTTTDPAVMDTTTVKTTVAPDKSGIDHVVVVMMENRSFDHLLGWVPGADGKQAGLTYTDADGNAFATHELAPDYQGCGHTDPDHSYDGGRVEYDNGACDGWLRADSNDTFSIGYYSKNDLAFFSHAIPRWETNDRYFAAMLAPTYPNRIYQHAAQTDRLDGSFTISTLPTIWDELAANNIPAHYYFSDVPFLALWGAKYLPISRPVTQFISDAITGNLPAVSFVDPRFLGETQGVSGDDHPFSDIRNGEAFLNIIYSAVVRSPEWRHTVLVINFDEWGGFFDHVPPPTAPIPPATAAAGDTDGRLGFRVPTLIVAPWATPGTVNHEQFDHTSVLKMIEWRWGLAPLTVRDATANNLADALDFSRKNAPRPMFDVPLGPFGHACSTTAAPALSTNEFTDLAAIATGLGFNIGTATNADLAAELNQLLKQTDENEGDD